MPLISTYWLGGNAFHILNAFKECGARPAVSASFFENNRLPPVPRVNQLRVVLRGQLINGPPRLLYGNVKVRTKSGINICNRYSPKDLASDFSIRTQIGIK